MHEAFIKRIRTAWGITPAIIEIKEIKDQSDRPDETTCDKGKLYIGIISDKYKDRLIVVKHCQTFSFTLSERVEELSDAILADCGLIPNKSNMICRHCHQFSTYINPDGLCYDCYGIQNSRGQ